MNRNRGGGGVEDNKKLLLASDGKQNVHKSHSSTARCNSRPDGILEIDYFGAISQGSFHCLDAATSIYRLDSCFAIERMDSAMTLLGPTVIGDEGWLPGTPPSVVIVREDQYDHSMQFCRALAERGILRMTFHQWQQDYALSFLRISQSTR